MLAALAAVVLSAAPATPSYALPGLNPVNLTPAEAQMFTELLAQAFQRNGFRVMSARDIGAVLGLERQKALVNCSEGSSCLTELVASVGADGLIIGDVGKLGRAYVLNVKVLSVKDGATLALYNARALEAEKLPLTIEDAAFDLAHQLAEALKRPDLEPRKREPEVVAVAASPPPPAQRHHKLWALAPLAVGAAGLGVGIGFQLQAEAQFRALKSAGTPQAARDAAGQGQSAELIANVSLGVGVAGLATAAVVYFTGSSPSVQPVAWVAPGGGGLGLTGVLP